MRDLIFFLCLFFTVKLPAQLPDKTELYKKIQNYYSSNPYAVEFVKYVQQNPLSYDTLVDHFLYIELPGKSFIVGTATSDFIFRNGLLVSGDNYIIYSDRP